MKSSNPIQEPPFFLISLIIRSVKKFMNVKARLLCAASCNYVWLLQLVWMLESYGVFACLHFLAFEAFKIETGTSHSHSHALAALARPACPRVARRRSDEPSWRRRTLHRPGPRSRRDPLASMAWGLGQWGKEDSV